MKLFEQLRAALQPSGTAPIVRLAFNGYSEAAYFNVEFVHKCIDTLERKTMLAANGIEPMNDLEKLAAQLLMDSAYIERKPT